MKLSDCLVLNSYYCEIFVCEIVIFKIADPSLLLESLLSFDCDFIGFIKLCKLSL